MRKANSYDNMIHNHIEVYRIVCPTIICSFVNHFDVVLFSLLLHFLVAVILKKAID